MIPYILEISYFVRKFTCGNIACGISTYIIISCSKEVSFNSYALCTDYI